MKSAAEDLRGGAAAVGTLMLRGALDFGDCGNGWLRTSRLGAYEGILILEGKL